MKRHLKALSLVFVLVLLAGALVACGSSEPTGATSSSSSSSADSKSKTVKSGATGKYATGTHHAVVSVEGYEPFSIELYADSAPVTVANFCELAESGFYNGLRFYRIVEGFCMQGGTKGNSASITTDPVSPILGEFSLNKVENPLADEFKRGTVAMARSGEYNSATSTFFITLATSENVSLSLDGQYAAFGMIDDAGMSIVDSIVKDYLKYATGEMGAISNTKDMPLIQSITITD